MVEKLNQIIESYQLIIKEIDETESKTKNSKTLADIEGRRNTDSVEQELVTKARVSAKIVFDIKNIFTPKITLATTKPIVIHESKPLAI